MRHSLEKNNNNSNFPVWEIESVEIKNPDPVWIIKGNEERQKLYKLLSIFGVTEIEHIGSTSIPNLPAKPIIDLMASIPSMEQINEMAQKLVSYGWHYVPPELDNRPWRRFFVKVKNDKRAAHLHLMLKGEERWRKQLLFRNTLRANSHLVEEYAILKRRLAKEFANDREAYTEAKAEFVKRVLLMDHNS